MPLKLKTRERKPSYFEVELVGQLDTHTHQQLEQNIEFLFESPVRGLQLNLDQLEYISSMGLRVVLMTAKRCQAAGAAFMLANLQPSIKAVFDIAAAVPMDSIFASVEEADEYFDRIQREKRKG